MSFLMSLDSSMFDPAIGRAILAVLVGLAGLALSRPSLTSTNAPPPADD